MFRCWPLLMALVLSACVTGNDFDRLRGDVRELQSASQESRRDIDALREKTTGMAQENSLAAIRESQADLLTKNNETARGLQELRGRFDENRYFTEKSFRDFSTEKELIRTQIAGLESQIKAMKERLALLEGGSRQIPAQADAAGVGTSAQAPPKEDASGRTAEPVPDSATGAYDAAYQLFKDKKYKEARERFDAFLREFGKSDLADNAQFWIAESYFAEKDFENAILSYETLLKKYPDSSKAAGGMYKQGLAFIEIGDAKTGRIILNKVIEKYPSAKDAELAIKKIAELDKKQPRKK